MTTDTRRLITGRRMAASAVCLARAASLRRQAAAARAAGLLPSVPRNLARQARQAVQAAELWRRNGALDRESRR